MAVVIKLNPTSPGQRHVKRVRDNDLYSGRPYSKLVEAKRRTGGRNNLGRVTCRRGGGHKKQYRIIDFKRNDKDGIIGKIVRVEYDPNRTANIALVLYADGERRYVLAADGMSVGDEIVSGEDVAVKSGNVLPLRNIPVGSIVHAVELKPGKGAQLARSAGASVALMAREGAYVMLRLRSGEVRRVHVDCRAVIGVVSNPKHNLISLGKAGASRYRGRRPHVRGVAMNPVDHPMGGGEGRTSGGGHPVSKNGIPAKGYRTRSNKRTQKYIVRSRHRDK